MNQSSSFEETYEDSREWLKLINQAERRRVSNRNAQRRYRDNMKRRMEALDQHCTGNLSAISQQRRQSVESEPTMSQSDFNQQSTDAASFMSGALGVGHGHSEPVSYASTMCDPSLSTSSMPSFEALLDNTIEAPIDQMPQVSPDSNQDYYSAMSELSGDVRRPSLVHTNSSSTQLSVSSFRDGRSTRTGSIDADSEYSAQDWSLKGGNALHLAAIRGHEAVVRVLLTQMINVNEKDGYGWTALHHAADRGHSVIVDLLLGHGADPLTRI